MPSCSELRVRHGTHQEEAFCATSPRLMAAMELPWREAFRGLTAFILEGVLPIKGIDTNCPVGVDSGQTPLWIQPPTTGSPRFPILRAEPRLGGK